MSIEPKITLMNSLENQLSTKVPSAYVDSVMSALSDQLTHFHLTQIDDTDAEADDLLDAYISAMQIGGRSEKTIARYKYIITKMMKKVKVQTRKISVYHLRQYLTDERNRKVGDHTLEGERQVFSAYFNWLQREGLIDHNPTANLGSIKYAKKVKQIYSDVEMEKLKRYCKTKRDYAIVTFLRSTGCRISEMTNLNRDAVDLKSLECIVVGKGNKERTVYLSSVAGAAIAEYLEERTDDYEALFIGKGTKRIHPGGVRFMLTKLAERSGVEHVHPHKFRRTLATTLIKHGMPIQEVATVLGHDKLDTTMQYVVLDKTDVKYSYRKYS